MASTEQTLTKLRELRLSTMAEAYALQLEQPKLHDMSFDDRFAMIVDHEATARETRKLRSLIGDAGFPESATLEGLDTRPSRGLDKAQIASLATCGWMLRQQNLIILGATGAGKTWLACAFGNQACRLRLPVAFYRSIDLYAAISTAIADGSLARLKKQLLRPTLLVIDDLGLGELGLQVAHVLQDIVDRRMRTKSLLITSQYPIDRWHDLFPDPTLADAILDRIVHQAHRLQLTGDSLRKLYAKNRME